MVGYYAAAFPHKYLEDTNNQRHYKIARNESHNEEYDNAISFFKGIG